MINFFELEGALVASLRSLEEQGHQEVDKMNTMYGQTDTFLKLLLRNEALQDAAIEMLLGKILWLMGEASDANDGCGNSQMLRQQSEHERLATQVFNHIRWCEVSERRTKYTCTFEYCCFLLISYFYNFSFGMILIPSSFTVPLFA